MKKKSLSLTSLAGLLVLPMLGHAALLVEAPLRDGLYGGGIKVDMFTSCSQPSGAGCGDGNLHEIGIAESSQGVTFLATQADLQSNAVVSWYLRGISPDPRTQFRTVGTVSFAFKADLASHVGGHILTDNYGFNQFNNGQGAFNGAVSRYLGPDGQAKTADDRLSFGFSTWHNSVWRSHIAANTALTTYDQWHRVGLTWGGPTHDFELWIDGQLAAYDDPFSGPFVPWGAAYLGLGSATNFALGDIHERGIDGENGTSGMTFADLRIWNEYVPLGDSLAPIPEPGTWALLLAGLGLLAMRRNVSRTRRQGRPGVSMMMNN
ncbi:MAG: PEP-CTERM sorting domain-containing protein [Thiobacillaceae bacterium]|nr:PEP-CTERM sorting domain-containing protein [Thiobacillaceae bacterium]